MICSAGEYVPKHFINPVTALRVQAVPVIGGRPFIVMGADVTHPTSFSEVISFITAGV